MDGCVAAPNGLVVALDPGVAIVDGPVTDVVVMLDRVVGGPNPGAFLPLL